MRTCTDINVTITRYSDSKIVLKATNCSKTWLHISNKHVQILLYERSNSELIGLLVYIYIYIYIFTTFGKRIGYLPKVLFKPNFVMNTCLYYKYVALVQCTMYNVHSHVAYIILSAIQKLLLCKQYFFIPLIYVFTSLYISLSNNTEYQSIGLPPSLSIIPVFVSTSLY